MRSSDFSRLSAAVGFLLVSVASNVAAAQDPTEPVGVAPTPSDAKQFSLDEDNIGVRNNVTPVDADDLSSAIPGIDGMAYVYQTFQPTPLGLGPSPPAGHHNAVLNPFDLGLRRNVRPVLVPPVPLQTHKDEVNALSYGNDLFYLDGVPMGHPLGEEIPFQEREHMGPFEEPIMFGGTRVDIEFSVDVHSKGVAGSGVSTVAVLIPPPLEPSSHVFLAPALAPGTNSVLYTDTQLAVFKNDDVDAYENVPPKMAPLQHPDQLGMPAGDLVDNYDGTNGANSGPGLVRPRVYFSVDNETQGHNPLSTGRPNAVNAQASLGEASGDVFVGIGGGNLLLIDETQLGLWPGGVGIPFAGFDDADDLDALAMHIHLDPILLEDRIREAVETFDPWRNPADDPNILGITQPLLGAGDAAVLFSVEEGSIGMWGSAVDYEHRIDPSEESADLFFSDLSGQNWLSYEASGPLGLGLLEHDELDALDTGTVPEPSTLAMLAAVGLMGVLAFARRRRAG